MADCEAPFHIHVLFEPFQGRWTSERRSNLRSSRGRRSRSWTSSRSRWGQQLIPSLSLSASFPDPGWDRRARDQNLPAPRCRLWRRWGVQGADQSLEGVRRRHRDQSHQFRSRYQSLLSAAHWCLCPLFQASIPFAVIGSNQLIEVKGKKIRGRLYPWGVVEVENPEHNDFLKLRTMLVWVSADGEVGQMSNTCQFETFAANLYCLLVCKGRNCRCRTHMQDLQEVTQDLHYENFRSERLKRACR